MSQRRRYYAAEAEAYTKKHNPIRTPVPDEAPVAPRDLKISIHSILQKRVTNHDRVVSGKSICIDSKGSDRAVCTAGDPVDSSQRAVLQALAVGGATEIYSSAVRQEYDLGPPSSIQRTLQSLDDHEILDQFRDLYFFVDPLFAIWITKH